MLLMLHCLQQITFMNTQWSINEVFTYVKINTYLTGIDCKACFKLGMQENFGPRVKKHQHMESEASAEGDWQQQEEC